MLRMMKIMSMLSVFFLFESFSMTHEFNRVITGNATNKQNLFRELQRIPDGEDKVLADKYMSLYGDNAPEEEDRKKILMTTDFLKKNNITGAAAYVVKSLFNQAGKDIYSVDTLDECIRVARLLLMDAPELANSNPMNNIDSILRAAENMRAERIKFQSDIAKLYAELDLSFKIDCRVASEYKE